MNKIIWPILALLLILCACQPRAKSITILNGEQVLSLSTAKTVPAEILAEANITLGANDRLLYLGSSIPLDTALPDARSYTLTVRRAVALSIVAPDGQQTIQTSALTVPGRVIVVTVDGTRVRVCSAAATVGQALAEAGVPLVGLDISRPGESAPLPENGQIRVVRVVESVVLTQKTIPFSTSTELSADLEIDQQVLLQGGEPGLATARLRTRSEDGMQVSQQSESESVVRPPQDRIMGFGTKIVIRTTTVDGETIEYWRALNIFATYYQPCDAGTNKCYYDTASGRPVQKGVGAMVYPWYLLFVGEPLYIPGYGFATVEDTNGANTSAYGDTYWIDLGYSQTDSVDWVPHHVTVYFLTPVPANPGYILP
ncbi:MAG: G5 domain-containing protein [Chloroflexi bacterium]|nr:G5 domain-containing protein [Chloroflexota bacterium]